MNNFLILSKIITNILILYILLNTIFENNYNGKIKEKIYKKIIILIFI